jgi:mRNA interferase MazF
VTRGEIRTVAGAGVAGKPRPALIVQDDRFAATTSVTVIGFTTDPTDAPLVRPLIQPDAANGLQRPSRLMVDKMVTVRRDRLGRRVGRLAAADMVRVERALALFLGLAA